MLLLPQLRDNPAEGSASSRPGNPPCGGRSRQLHRGRLCAAAASAPADRLAGAPERALPDVARITLGRLETLRAPLQSVWMPPGDTPDTADVRSSTRASSWPPPTGSASDG